MKDFMFSRVFEVLISNSHPPALIHPIKIEKSYFRKMKFFAFSIAKIKSAKIDSRYCTIRASHYYLRLLKDIVKIIKSLVEVCISERISE